MRELKLEYGMVRQKYFFRNIFIKNLVQKFEDDQNRRHFRLPKIQFRQTKNRRSSKKRELLGTADSQKRKAPVENCPLRRDGQSFFA